MPSGVLLPDGRIRIYFCQQSFPTPQNPYYVIRSAISSDGLNFAQEPGIRVNATGIPGDPKFSVCDPSVVRLKDNSYRIFYAGMNSSNLMPGVPGVKGMWRIYTALSADGLTFTNDSPAIDPTDSMWMSKTQDKFASQPSAGILPDGRIAVYYEGTGHPSWCQTSSCILYEEAETNDGVNFVWTGILAYIPTYPAYGNPLNIPLSARSWVNLPDGKIMLVLYAAQPPGSTYPPGFYVAYSTEGLNFGPPVEVLPAPFPINNTNCACAPPLSDPDLVPLPDGSFRLYYVASVQQNQQILYSAHWTPLLPARTDSSNVTAGSSTYKVTVTHNSSLRSLGFNLSSFTLSLGLSGPVGFYGHALVTFPSKLLAGIYSVTLDNTPLRFEMNSTASMTSIGFAFDQGTDLIFKISGTASGNFTRNATTASTTSATSTSSSTSTSILSSGATSHTTGSVQGGGGITLTYATVFAIFVAGALVVGFLVGFVIMPARRKSSRLNISWAMRISFGRSPFPWDSEPSNHPLQFLAKVK